MATAARKNRKPSRKTLHRRKVTTLKEVWALMRENAERQKETERIFKERDERSEREYERERRERIEQYEQEKKEKKEKEEQYERERRERIEQYEQEKKEKKEKEEQYERERRERIEQYEQEKKEKKEKEEQYEREKRERDEKFEREKRESAEKFEREKKESAEKFEREKKESAEKFEREKRESDEKFRREKNVADKELMEIKRIVRRNSKQMGELHQRFGQLAEHLVAPGIAKRFNELGYHFNAMLPKGQKIFDEKTGKIRTEIDLILENGKTIMAVEVKTRPVIQDVEHHIKRLEILRDHRRTIINDQRKVQGAIAGAVFEDDVKKAVREAGMYVIEQSGDTMKIDMPDGFIPREW